LETKQLAHSPLNPGQKYSSHFSFLALSSSSAQPPGTAKPLPAIRCKSLDSFFGPAPPASPGPRNWLSQSFCQHPLATPPPGAGKKHFYVFNLVGLSNSTLFPAGQTPSPPISLAHPKKPGANGTHPQPAAGNPTSPRYFNFFIKGGQVGGSYGPLRHTSRCRHGPV